MHWNRKIKKNKTKQIPTKRGKECLLKLPDRFCPPVYTADHSGIRGCRTDDHDPNQSLSAWSRPAQTRELKTRRSSVKPELRTDNEFEGDRWTLRLCGIVSNPGLKGRLVTVLGSSSGQPFTLEPVSRFETGWPKTLIESHRVRNPRRVVVRGISHAIETSTMEIILLSRDSSQPMWEL